MIGEGARVGANAVVVKDVPPHSTVVGIPARVVRVRESQGIAEVPELPEQDSTEMVPPTDLESTESESTSVLDTK